MRPLLKKSCRTTGYGRLDLEGFEHDLKMLTFARGSYFATTFLSPFSACRGAIGVRDSWTGGRRARPPRTIPL
jgi:hypothetical protein